MFASAKGKKQKQVRQVQCQEQRIDHIPYYLSGLSRSPFFPTTPLEVAVAFDKPGFQKSGQYTIKVSSGKVKVFVISYTSNPPWFEDKRFSLPAFIWQTHLRGSLVWEILVPWWF